MATSSAMGEHMVSLPAGTEDASANVAPPVCLGSDHSPLSSGQGVTLRLNPCAWPPSSGFPELAKLGDEATGIHRSTCSAGLAARSSSKNLLCRRSSPFNATTQLQELRADAFFPGEQDYRLRSVMPLDGSESVDVGCTGTLG